MVSFQNVVDKWKFTVRKEQDKRDARVNQPATVGRPAFLGDNQGVLYVLNGTTLPDGYVVVRDMDGNLSSAFNQRVPNQAGTVVLVGYDPLAPTLFQVLSTRDYWYDQPLSSVPSHHKSHEWPAPDAIWVRQEQYLPGLLAPIGGFSLQLYPVWLQPNNVWCLVAYQTLDLSPYVPTTGARMVLIAVDEFGTVHYTTGATKFSPYSLLASDIPGTPGGQVPLAAVRLFKGQTAIRKTQNYTDIFDLRSGGGGTGGGAIWGQITGSLIDQTDLWNSLISILGGHTHGTTRWTSVGGTTYDLPDIAMELIGVYDNSLRVDPLEISLSSDGTQVIFNTAPTVGHVITADYILEQI